MGSITKIGNGPSIKGYKIVDVIGSGGMATIFKGVQESLRRSVVIKELSHICAQDQTLSRGSSVNPKWQPPFHMKTLSTSTITLTTAIRTALLWNMLKALISPI